MKIVNNKIKDWYDMIYREANGKTFSPCGGGILKNYINNEILNNFIELVMIKKWINLKIKKK